MLGEREREGGREGWREEKKEREKAHFILDIQNKNF